MRLQLIITVFLIILINVNGCRAGDEKFLRFEIRPYARGVIQESDRKKILEITRQRMILAGFDKTAFTAKLEGDLLNIVLHQGGKLPDDFIRKLSLLISTQGNIRISETYTNHELFSEMAKLNFYLQEKYPELPEGIYSVILPARFTRDGEDIMYEGPISGYAFPYQIQQLERILKEDTIRAILPADLLIKPAVPVRDSLHPLITVSSRYVDDYIPFITGRHIADAVIAMEDDMHEMQIQLDTAGTRHFLTLSYGNAGRYLAIEMDGLVLFYPHLPGAITDGFLGIPLSTIHPAYEIFVIAALTGELPARLVEIQ